MLGAEQPAQGGKSHSRSPAGERLERNLKARPSICMLIVVPAAQGTLPQSRQGIPLRINRPLFVGGIRSMEQVALFDGE